MKKTQNQQKEYYSRLLRIEEYTTEYENYQSQQTRINKQLNKLKEKKNDSLVWKSNLKLEGNDGDEYDVAIFNYPKYKRYILSKDKVNIVEKRLKHEKTYLSFLQQKIRKNKY